MNIQFQKYKKKFIRKFSSKHGIIENRSHAQVIPGTGNINRNESWGLIYALPRAISRLGLHAYNMDSKF